MTQKKLTDCNEPGPQREVNIDKPSDMFCHKDPTDPPSQKDVPTDFGSLFSKDTLKKTGLGHHALCDPIQTGQIVNDLRDENPNKQFTSYIYRYSKAIRGTDEAMTDLFRNLVVIDDDGKAFPVPIIYGTQERAIAAIMQDNVRKDSSLVVDRLRLPMLAVHNTGIEFNQDKFIYQQALDYGRDIELDGHPSFTTQEGRFPRDTIFGFTRGLPLNINYTLLAWTLHVEDMNQIIEQILLKFSPQAYIKTRGIPWEIVVNLNSVGNNINYQPGDEARRVVKYSFDMRVETFLPQPITRKKAVLKTQIDLVQPQRDKINTILSKIEEAVKGFE